jgi:hypothetical protein
MKKFLIILAFIITSYPVLMAQDSIQNVNTQPKKWNQISVGLGTSLWGSLTNVFVKGAIVKKAFATPVMSLQYTRLWTKKIGVGAGIYYQNFHYDLLPLDNSKSGLNANINRMNFSLHTEYYFVQNKKFDMYFGGEIGMTFWWGKVSFNALRDYVNDVFSDFPFIADQINKVLIPSDNNFATHNFSKQIYGGMDYFFNKNIGLKAELALGAPYWSKIALNVRF